MNDYEWEDLRIGQKEFFTVLVNNEKMKAFCNMTGDINPLHRDEGFAKQQGYSGVVCYGLLTTSFLSTLAGVYLPGRKSLIQEVNVKLIRPVFEGDELTVSGVIEDLNDTVRQILLKVIISNQNGEKVLRGKMKVGMLSGESNFGDRSIV